MNRFLEAVDPTPADIRTNYSHLFVAGLWGGLLQCVVITPTELVKCRLQIQNDAAGPVKYRSSWHCMADVSSCSGCGVPDGLQCCYLCPFVLAVLVSPPPPSSSSLLLSFFAPVWLRLVP